MNTGERDELLAQIKLIELRDSNSLIKEFGKVYSVGYLREYKKLDPGFQLNYLKKYSNDQVQNFALSLGITKSSSLMKADTVINDKAVSIKSNNQAPPALVNHTTRPGFEFAAMHSGGDIDALDKIIYVYWGLRKAGIIGEDIKNSQDYSPFASNKLVLKPFLNFFLFDGTGSRLSKKTAEFILSFTDPLDTETWSVYDRSNAIDLYWDKLIFSLRAKKGMPTGYPNVTDYFLPKKPSIDKWTEFIDSEYRGALHIRSGH